MRKTIEKIIFKIIVFLLIFIAINCNIFAYLEETNNEEININKISETVAEASIEPKLDARIGLIYDRTSKRILYEKNGNKQTPMASTTKIMSSIIVLENANLTDVVTIGAKAAGTGGSRLGLKKNDKITVNDLLYGLMLKSGNDAAVALAIHVGGSIEGFAQLMNKKAEELGLINSHFITPHGLDADGHYTTAYELACITDYALNIPKFKEIVHTKAYTVTINNYGKTITNTNELLGNLNGVYGVKTGFTNGAGRCLVTSCKRGQLDIITVVLGADTKKIRTSDSIKLIEYANKNYKVINLEEIIIEKFEEWKKINEKRIIINKGVLENVELSLQEIECKNIAIKITDIDKIETQINSLFYLEAPVEEKEIIGNMKIKIGEETINVLKIYSKIEIRKKEIKEYFLEFLRLMP